MSRLLEQPVHIEEGADGLPDTIYWLTGRERVENVLDAWAEVGEWWIGEPPKRFYRVVTNQSRVYELYREEPPLARPPQKKLRHSQREGENPRPTDEKHVAEFHLQKGGEERHDVAKSSGLSPRRWIVYKLLD